MRSATLEMFDVRLIGRHFGQLGQAIRQVETQLFTPHTTSSGQQCFLRALSCGKLLCSKLGLSV